VISGRAAGGGCELYFERRGSGPPLLLIVGGGGDCGYYEEVAGILADEFTVLSYDRRGNSRSILHGPPAPLVMRSAGCPRRSSPPCSTRGRICRRARDATG
jgi:pimeloyl-ACP methyl ester carboxylesterase